MILVHELSRICKNGWRFTRDQLTHSYLSNEAYDICAIIYYNRDCNQELVARRLNMDKSSVAKIITKCVKSGLIIRKRDHEDKRNYHLDLSEEGKATICELIESVDMWQKATLSVLSEAEQEVFLRMVSKIKQKSDELATKQ